MPSKQWKDYAAVTADDVGHNHLAEVLRDRDLARTDGKSIFAQRYSLDGEPAGVVKHNARKKLTGHVLASSLAIDLLRTRPVSSCKLWVTALAPRFWFLAGCLDLDKIALISIGHLALLFEVVKRLHPGSDVVLFLNKQNHAVAEKLARRHLDIMFGYHRRASRQPTPDAIAGFDAKDIRLVLPPKDLRTWWEEGMRFPDDNEPVAGGKRRVRYVINRDSPHTLHVALARELQRVPNLYCRGRDSDPVLIQGSDEPRMLKPNDFLSLVDERIEVSYYRHTNKRGIQPTKRGFPSLFDCKVLMRSRILRGVLPPLTHYVRTAVFTKEWRFVGEPGYDAETGIYYDGRQVEILAGQECLDELLRDYHWASDVDRVNYIGALLTGLTLPHWTGWNQHPMITISANRIGAGKSSLAQILSALIDRRHPKSITYGGDDELERRIAANVALSHNVIVIDNVKSRRTVSSPCLERTITDASPSFRRIRTSELITRPTNDLIFVMTMNDARLSRDLVRRALPITLEMNQQSETVEFSHDNIVEFAEEHYEAIIGELAGMVQRWIDEGRPIYEDAAKHSLQGTWAQTIDSILRYSGIEGFLANYREADVMLDPVKGELRDLLWRYRDAKPARAAEWVERCIEHDLLVEQLGLRNRSKKSADTRVGNTMRRYVGDLFHCDDNGEKAEIRLVAIQSRGGTHGTWYGVELIGD